MSTKPILPTKKEMDDYRKKHFAVKIGPSRDGEGEHTVNITFNGTQSQSIAFNIDELKSLKSKIGKYLTSESENT